MGVEAVLLVHVVVPVGLGQYRGGGNALILGVALDNADILLAGLVDEPVAVDEQQLGLHT